MNGTSENEPVSGSALDDCVERLAIYCHISIVSRADISAMEVFLEKNGSSGLLELCERYDEEFESFRTNYKIIKTAAILLCVVGIIVNVAFLLAVWRKRLRTSTDVYMLSIAVADLVICSAFAVMSLPVYNTNPVLHALFDSIEWQIPIDATIKFGMYAALITTTCFTLERALAVCRPLAIMAHCSKNRSARMVIYSWGATALFAVIEAVVKFTLIKTGNRATLNRLQTKAFLVEIVPFYFLPLICAVIAFFVIVLSLRSRQRLFRASRGGQSGPAGDGGAVGPPAATAAVIGNGIATLGDDNRQRSLQHRKHRKVSRLMFCVALTYIVFLTPHRIYSLLCYVAPQYPPLTAFPPALVLEVFSIVYLMNSLSNPVICWLFSDNYRQLLVSTLRHIRRPSNRHRMSTRHAGSFRTSNSTQQPFYPRKSSATVSNSLDALTKNRRLPPKARRTTSHV